MWPNNPILFALSLWVATATSLISSNVGVVDFNDNGWDADDTRNSAGTNIINGTTHAPAAGATLDPTQVSNQMDWLNTLGSLGNLGGTRFDTSASASQKSTLSVVDDSTGLVAASMLNDNSFSATYRWQNNDTVAAGLALKFGIQSTVYGTGTGESQNGFSATRSGEATWDLILVFDPTNNGQNSTTDGQFLTSTVTKDSQFFLFPQAGSSFWSNTYGATGSTLGIGAGSKTLDEWAALDIDGAGVETTTWGDMLFDTGAIVSNTQFGMGSGNDGATTTLDWAEVSFLNDGDRIDFVDAARYDGGGTDTSDYGDGDNWSGVTPSSTQNIFVDSTGTTNLTVSAVSQETRSLGILAGTTNLTINSGSTLILASSENGTLSADTGATLNVLGDGTLNASVVESGGVINIATQGTFDGGANPNPVRDGSNPAATSRYGLVVLAGGEATLQSGADITVSQTNLNAGVRVGEGDGTGTLNIESGANLDVGNDTVFTTLTSNGFFVAGDFGSTGIVNQTGGSFRLTDGSFNLGNQGGTGTYNLSDGTATLRGGLHSLGRNTGTRSQGSGTINLSGGTFEITSSPNNGNATFVIGDRSASTDPLDDGIGTLNQTGGTFRVESGSNLFLGGHGSSTYDLQAGTLEIGGNSLQGLYQGNATGSYDFNLQGGTIRVIDSNLTSTVDIDVVDIDPTAAVTVSTIDTNGFNATLSGILSGDGGLAKTGLGTLNLSGASRTLGYLSSEAGTIDHFSGTTNMGSLLAGSYASTADSNGTFTLTDGTVNINANGGSVFIGSGSSGNNTGVLNINGGVLNLGVDGEPSTRVDFYAGAFGSTGLATVNQTGGTVNKLSDQGVFHIGNQASGIYNLNDGAINIIGQNGMVLGRSGGSGDGTGVLNISGGTLTFTNGADLLLGGAQDSEPTTGSGTVNQTGGTVSFQDNGNLVIGQRGAGAYNLDGGVLEIGGTNGISTGNSGTATFSLGGGMLSVSGASLTIASDIMVDLKNGTNSTLNTNALNATLNGGIGGSGNITKTGTGTLFINGTSTNTGNVTVSNGLLSVGGTLGGNSIIVASGASIGGSGEVSGSTTVNGTLAPGNSPGIITFSDGLTIESSATVEMEFLSNVTTGRGTNFDGIDVTGGVLSINPDATLSLVFNAAGSDVDFTDLFWTSNQTWLLMDNSSSPTIIGSVFNSILTTTDSNGLAFSSTGGFFSVFQTGNDIFLGYVVPEPSTYAMILGSIILVCCLIRRRKKA